MVKVKVTMGTTYCGCPKEEVEFEYEGTRDEFDRDDSISTDIINMIFNNEFPHYFLEIEAEEVGVDELEEFLEQAKE